MEKKILLELHRMKSLIGYDRTLGGLISEQEGAEIRQNYLDKQTLDSNPNQGGPGPFERYTEVKLGPSISGKYPIMFDIEIPIMGEQITGNPIIWQFEPETTAKKFISGVKVGPVINGDGKTINNQEYILRKFTENGKSVEGKFCLPSKEFWDAHTDKNYIYKFQNPKNAKTFNIRLTQQKPGKCIVNGIAMSGSECSKRCLGGSNGWEFNLNGFYLTGSDKPYDPSKVEDFSLNSDFDTFWDNYGTYIEILGAIAISFATAGLGSWLVAAAEAGTLASWITPIVEGLNVAYAGSEATWLTVLIESVGEALVMSPLVYYQWERGQTANAALTMVFSFLPFALELKTMKKWTTTGVKFSKNTSDTLTKKFLDAGGSESVLSNQESMQKFIIALSPDEQNMFTTALKVMGDEEGFKKTFEEVLDVYGDKIYKSMVNSSDKTVSEKVAYYANKTLNPVSGKGILPQFLRAGIVIGPMAIGFTNVWDSLISSGVSEEEAIKKMNQIKEATENSPYVKMLLELNKKLGLGVGLTQEQFDEAFTESMKNPEFKNKTDEQSKVIFEEELKKQVKESVKNKTPEIVSELKEIGYNGTDIISLTDKYMILDKKYLINELLKQLLNQSVIWENETQYDYGLWNFKVNNQNGFVKFNGGAEGTYEIYVNDKLIFPLK